MKFDMTKDELRERCQHAGRKRAAQQKADKAFGWTKHTRERTRLSPPTPTAPRSTS